MRPLSLLSLGLALGCAGSKDGPPDTAPGRDTSPYDLDGDGWADDEDCDESDEDINPGATEVCDGQDNDCDGQIDEDVLTTYYADVDADGFGDPDARSEACSAPPGYVPLATDCDDHDDEAWPGHPEDCDGVDNNCDGAVDEGLTSTWYADRDGDGYGAPDAPLSACEDPGAGTSAAAGDCDDEDEAVNPAAEEICDDRDNDCDGEADEAFLSDDFTSGLPAGLELNGDAAWKSGLIRLTEVKSGGDLLYDQVGSAMFEALLPSDRWKVRFTVSIHDGDGLDRPDGRIGSGGDGMALVMLYGASASWIGDGGEHLGYYDADMVGYAVEFDTYCNANYGTAECYYVYSDYGDPSSNHVALVDVATMQHLSSVTDLSTLQDGGDFAVEVSFSDGELLVVVDDGLSAWELSETLGDPPEDAVRLGFTAGTGWEINDHDLDDLFIGCP